MTGSSSIILENSVGRFLLMMAAAILDVNVNLLWSTETTLEVEVCVSILAVQSQG